MRVLHLIKTCIGATWAFRQVRELVKLGVEVHVALPDGGPLVHDYESAGAVVHLAQFDFPIRQPWLCGATFRQLRSLVERLQPDIIHSHHVGTTLTMRLALGKAHPIPRIFQVPGPLHLEHSFFQRSELATAGPSDYWVGSCQWTCNRYRSLGIPENRVFLSYYGIDLDLFVAKKRGALREELGVGLDTKIVGTVAYMYAPKRYLGQTRGLKGHEDLIDAIAICLKTKDNLLGIFVGGAWDHADAYETRVRKYGGDKLGDQAIFLGTRHDVPDIYPDFDVAVHASHSENAGGAVESLLLGIPTVATEVGGLPDVVIPGETGWLAPAKNPRELAKGILEALRDPESASQMAIRGKSRVEQVFDVKKTAAQVLDIYQTILSE